MNLIYENLADAATLGVSSTAGTLVGDNMKSNAPELVWRAVNKQPTITLTWETPQKAECVAVAWTNLSATAQITFRLFTNPLDVTAAQTKTITAGATGIGCVYSAFFATGSTARKVTIYIDDPNNTAEVQVGRVISGPVFKTSRQARPGASLSLTDRSSVSRAESGTLRVETKGVHRTLTAQFDMMDPTEANLHLRLLMGGTSRVVFACLYPDPLHPQHYTHGLLGRPTSGYEQVLAELGMASGTLSFEEIVSP